MSEFDFMDNQIASSALSGRDSYIDFLRASGLLLLVVAHTWPPAWLFNVRTFDVPLMVFISAACYNPLRGGYLAYCKKRIKRIYRPVLVFLTLFFILELTSLVVFGKPKIAWTTVLGSYMLLNSPSIGYVWIMRVFLMMALILPLLYNLMQNLGAVSTCCVIGGIIIMQHFLTEVVGIIDNQIVKFVLDETLLYAVGYSAIAILGLKIQIFKQSDLVGLMIACALAIGLFVYSHNMEFDPQAYKYPPQSLYLLYGIFASSFLWFLKPLYKSWRMDMVFRYLSENSMWIYLWHIIPVMAIACWADVEGMWLIRYLIVLVASIALNYGYNYVISKFSLFKYYNLL